MSDRGRKVNRNNRHKVSEEVRKEQKKRQKKAAKAVTNVAHKAVKSTGKKSSGGGANSSATHYTKKYAGATNNEQLNRRISNAKTRLNAHNKRKPPKYDADEASGRSTLGKTIYKVLDILDKPRNAYAVATRNLGRDGTLESAAKGFKSGWEGKEQRYGSDILADLGVKSTAGRVIGGIALDIAGDPLNLINTGAGSLAKGVVLAKGAGVADDALRAGVKASKWKLANEARDAVLKGSDVASLGELAKNMGKNYDEVNQAVKKIGYAKGLGKTLSLEDAKRVDLKELESTLDDYLMKQQRRTAEMKAGKGFTVAGKTIIPGTKLQDAGAVIGKATNKVAPIRKVRDTAGKMFNSTHIDGLGAGEEQIYRAIKNAAKGKQNLADEQLMWQIKNLSRLDKGIEIGGRPLREEIQNIISGATDTFPMEELKQVITTTASKKAAAKALGIGKDGEATVSDLLQFYMKNLNEAGEAELRAGKLKTMTKNYFPRVKADTLQNRRNARDMLMHRRSDYDGQAIRDINADYAARHGGGKLFEEDSLKAYANRMLSHNKIMADNEAMWQVISAFGKPIKDYDELAKLTKQGYAAVVPKQKFKALYNATTVVKDAKAEAKAAAKAGEQFIDGVDFGKITGNPKKILDEILDAATPFVSLDQSKAKTVLEGAPAMRTAMTALPEGLAELYNKQAHGQVVNALEVLSGPINKCFNSWWKPLVTSLNLKFHQRNLMSGSFQTFLDVGVDMFNPTTQRAALAVAGKDMGRLGNVKLKIHGVEYTADDIYKMMVKNNAISSYGATDATDFLGAGTDVNRIVKGKTPWGVAEGAGRAVGNTVERYIRATQFISNLKLGATPEQAADMVRKFQFDYADLTDFERALKSFIPFYTWMRNNLPLQLEQILEKPGMYSAIHRAQKSGGKETGIDPSLMPTYLEESGGIPFGYDENTNRIKILDIGSPQGDLFTTGRDLAGMVHPLIKAPIELGMNTSILTGGNVYNANDPYADATQLTEYGTRTRDKIVQALADALSNDEGENIIDDFAATPQGAKTARYLNYALNNAGLISKGSKYGTGIDSSKTLVSPIQSNDYAKDLRDRIKTGNQVADTTVKAIIGLLDPVNQNTSLFNPDAATYWQGYNYEKQLQAMLAGLRNSGADVATIPELRKAGLYNKYRLSDSLY